MSPSYIFRIDEIGEDANATHHVDNRGNWIPSTDPGANKQIGGGASGIWWLCNGQGISSLPQLPQGSVPYTKFSLYYSAGFGFWVLSGDATNPGRHVNWHPLRFDQEADYSSFLTNAGQLPTLSVQRPDQYWPRMLLPDIYHTSRTTHHQSYGGLVGELGIFLALMAFSVRPDWLTRMLPHMFTGQAWRTHNHPHGRHDQRGVVVHVYTYPSADSDAATELNRFQNGEYGKYFN